MLLLLLPPVLLLLLLLPLGLLLLLLLVLLLLRMIRRGCNLPIVFSHNNNKLIYTRNAGRICRTTGYLESLAVQYGGWDDALSGVTIM